MTAALHDRFEIFLRSLDHRSATDQHDAFINEVFETLGRFEDPSADRPSFWIELHGINASGPTEREAIANWKSLARKTRPAEDIEDDGFITVFPSHQQIAGGAA